MKVWRAQWREGGHARQQFLGRVCDVTRAEAREEFDRILSPLNKMGSRALAAVKLRQFVENEYLTTKSRVLEGIYARNN